MKMYRDLDIITKLKIYKYAIQLRKHNLGCKCIAKIIKREHEVLMRPKTINDWFNKGKTPLRGAAKEVLTEVLALHLNGQDKKYS